MSGTSFEDLETLAAHLRLELEKKRFILLYAYNGVGKTRLSAAFKELGKENDEPDTLYFNAFTEDLFSWDNDLQDDRERKLRLNKDSRFFTSLWELEMDNRIRPLLSRYADFDFLIDTAEWEIIFSRQVPNPKFDADVEDSVEKPTKTETHIKISRGEENIFIWCFFLAVVQLTMDGIDAYSWVKYIYIDDPISSLDENNAIAVANHLTQMLSEPSHGLKVITSTHHVLFFNVLCNEFKKKAHKRFLQKNESGDGYFLKDTTSTPFLHHLSALVELHEVQRTGALYTHHFNMMRRAMEQTANFFGLSGWQDCIKLEDDDPEQKLYKRIIDLMSHGDYSLYEPREMMVENKNHFRMIFRQFITNYPFESNLFPSEQDATMPPST